MSNIRSTSEKSSALYRYIIRFSWYVEKKSILRAAARMNSFYAVDRPMHLSNLLLFYVSDAYQIRSRRLDPLYEFDVLLS